MSSSADATADQAHEMMKDVADHWGLIVVLGVLSVILGILAIAYPGATIVTVSIFFAAWLFVSGIFYLISSFTRDGDTGSRVLSAILGVLSVIVGWALLRTPFQSVEVFIFVHRHLLPDPGRDDVHRRLRPQGRSQLGHRSAACSASSPGIIVLTYPISSAVTLALIAGIWLIILGVMQVVAGIQLRNAGSRICVAPPRPDGRARPAGRPDPAGLRAILSRGADRRPRRSRSRPRPGPRRPSLRRSSVVERAAVNRLVVSSNLTAGANPLLLLFRELWVSPDDSAAGTP